IVVARAFRCLRWVIRTVSPRYPCWTFRPAPAPPSEQRLGVQVEGESHAASHERVSARRRGARTSASAVVGAIGGAVAAGRACGGMVETLGGRSARVGAAARGDATESSAEATFGAIGVHAARALLVVEQRPHRFAGRERFVDA